MGSPLLVPAQYMPNVGIVQSVIDWQHLTTGVTEYCIYIFRLKAFDQDLSPGIFQNTHLQKDFKDNYCS